MTDGRPEYASSSADDGRALAELLRAIVPDLAHELRGPVQSVVVNLEVLRRRATAGRFEDVVGRADVIEEEVRRMHGLSDAFLGLLREPAVDPVTLSVNKLLAGATPIIDVVARTSRVRLVCDALPADILIRVRPEPAMLALVRLCVDAVRAAGEGGVVHVSGEAETDAFVMQVQVTTDGETAIGASHLSASAAAIEGWLARAGGTVTLGAGSDTGGAAAVIRLPRAT